MADSPNIRPFPIEMISAATAIHLLSVRLNRAMIPRKMDINIDPRIREVLEVGSIQYQPAMMLKKRIAENRPVASAQKVT